MFIAVVFSYLNNHGYTIFGRNKYIWLTKKVDVLTFFFTSGGPDPPTPLRQNDATGGQNRLLTHPLEFVLNHGHF